MTIASNSCPAVDAHRQRGGSWFTTELGARHPVVLTELVGHHRPVRREWSTRWTANVPSRLARRPWLIALITVTNMNQEWPAGRDLLDAKAGRLIVTPRVRSWGLKVHLRSVDLLDIP